MNTTNSQTPKFVRPTRVRYIKLGQGGKWERECVEKGIIRFGFDSASEERFPMCLGRQWGELTKSFVAQGKTNSTATRFTNETRSFFEDDGSILWITFVGECLYWGFLDNSQPQRHTDGEGVWRRIAGGWRKADLNGELLSKDRLSGALTKLAMYRGTSCSVDEEDYIVRRINGVKIPEVERALSATNEMESAVIGLMRKLGDRDFEILVDLVFSTSGWRRQGTVGKTQKTLDLDLILPTTEERAFVQIKSKTTSAELADYAGRLSDLGPYDKMFFVYHSGDASTDDERVTVIGPDRLAKLVIDAGLTNWLIHKVS